ncbi:MAG: hypothetical protein ACL7AY_09280 [Candidatus Arsenophonus phytopathogenicus]
MVGRSGGSRKARRVFLIAGLSTLLRLATCLTAGLVRFENLIKRQPLWLLPQPQLALSLLIPTGLSQNTPLPLMAKCHSLARTSVPSPPCSKTVALYGLVVNLCTLAWRVINMRIIDTSSAKQEKIKLEISHESHSRLIRAREVADNKSPL